MDLMALKDHEHLGKALAVLVGYGIVAGERILWRWKGWRNRPRDLYPWYQRVTPDIRSTRVLGFWFRRRFYKIAMWEKDDNFWLERLFDYFSIMPEW